ncbi:MAG: Asp-tRNA(Asn)/Glu-tRNA(Gln) amidotransferase subunit GatB [Alcanivoracaceae bacterium]|jgi:aspartyl-tRNA(Asn)/glutamyl-tRNA(Gln) amidotransferase subunit B|nr:Asp-tRNA(Asn)/Glu-tRNA(Gln) amidotransferase subunit GatB [Alcanivoracaceae bacterium]
MSAWETVIGLEIHVQLATKTKIFSSASTAVGAEPNSHASLVDLAMPGTLPVLNREAVNMAVKFGLAVGAEVNRRSAFERKNYFYPDLPKGYQTTQLAEPIVGAGKIELILDDGSRKTVRIHHAHLEEDAGKSLHEDFHGMTGIDLNRAGTPLIEVVTEPDMRSAEEAVAFARALHSLVTAIGICDGEMSQGSLRFDVNVSVRRRGEEKLGTRTETKNLNSFRFMEMAIRKEVERQIDILEDGGSITQETRLFNGDTGVSRSMRSKEDANDYRYFPCPDLLPVMLSEEQVTELKNSLPELPTQRLGRFVEQYGLSDYDARILSSDLATSDYFEAVAELSSDAKLAANWIMGELTAKLNAEEKSISECPMPAPHLAELIARLKDNTISSKIAKQVFEACWNGEGSPDQVIEARGLKQVSDSGELQKMVDKIIAENTTQAEAYRAADETKRKKMFGFFVGQAMKASQGKANPQQINELLMKALES